MNYNSFKEEIIAEIEEYYNLKINDNIQNKKTLDDDCYDLKELIKECNNFKKLYNNLEEIESYQILSEDTIVNIKKNKNQDKDDDYLCLELTRYR